MSKKDILLKKLIQKPIPKIFSLRELDTLMKNCGCKKFDGGRGSGIGYLHEATERIVQFDGPHPGNELYRYQIKMIIQLFKEVGEIK